jgi:hypothetical protein
MGIALLVVGLVLVVFATWVMVRHARNGKTIGPLVIVIFLGGLVSAGFGISDLNSSPSSTGMSSTGDTVIHYGPQTPRDNCKDGFYVQPAAHAENKVSSVQTTGDPTTWPAQAVQIAKHDPAVLQLYWNETPNGQKNPLTQAQLAKLVGAQGTKNYGCYTAAGRDLWNQMKGAYENATVTAGKAPAVGVNTGVNASTDTAFQEPSGPITGNRTAAVIKFQDGSVIWEMQRCKNIVTTSEILAIPGPSTPTCESVYGPSVTGNYIPGAYPNGCVKHCPKVACGPNGTNAPPVQSNPGIDTSPTPGYTPGGAEQVTQAQAPPANPYTPNPAYGSNPPPGQSAPPGADNGNTSGGGSSGVSHPTGTTTPGGTTPATGSDPCADPNATTCTAG